MNYTKKLLEKNNIASVFVGTGVTYYIQYIGEDKLYLTNKNCKGDLVYNITNNTYFKEYNNSKYVLNKYMIKAGDDVILPFK
jgi:predicted RNA-binding protein with EMAP domain